MARVGYGEFEFISLKEGILAPLNVEMITVKILLVFNFSKESSQCIRPYTKCSDFNHCLKKNVRILQPVSNIFLSQFLSLGHKVVTSG